MDVNELARIIADMAVGVVAGDRYVGSYYEKYYTAFAAETR